MSIRNGIRIGCCGAGGTGKTTSAIYLADKLDLPMNKSASRIIYEAKNLTEEKVLNEFNNQEKLDLQIEIFNTKIKLDKEFSYVTDRTILDHYAYCLAYCGGFIPDDQYLWFEETVRSHMLSTYTYVFYFPWGYWLPENEDGVRQTRLSWQSQIDAILVGYLNRWGIPAIIVPQTQGADVRNQFILNTIIGQSKEN